MIYQIENINKAFDFRCRLHNGWNMEEHIHEYTEILYCKSGFCQIEVNRKPILLNQNQFVLIPPNYIHQYKSTDAQLLCAVFSNDFVPFFFQLTQSKKITVKNLIAEDLTDILDSLYTIDRKNITLIMAYLNLICAKVIDNYDFEVASQSDSNLYQKVIPYISENFKENISLKQIAEEFNYNEKYLSHCLHTLTNMHFSQFIAMYRIEYAKKLLITKPLLTVSEIASHSGFSSINTFNRWFKKITNLTPLEYKKSKIDNYYDKTAKTRL